MSNAPIITIFVRHAASCKYIGDEFCKRCNCRKHFRWTQNGVQHRRKAGTRSWAEAEDNKRKLEDQLTGRIPTAPEQTEGKIIREAIKAFIQKKELADVSKAQRDRYRTELDRFAAFCESSGVYVVQRITQEMVDTFKGSWPKTYASTFTRREVQKRLRGFLSFCVYHKWLDRVPELDPIKITEPPTEPVTDAEYRAILAAVPGEFPNDYGHKVRAVIQLMRWSGLSVRDASELRRAEIIKQDAAYSIVRKRRKIVSAKGQDRAEPVFIPIPPDLGMALVAVANGNPEYVFWEKRRSETAQFFSHNMSIAISKVFSRAGVESAGKMVSHRLRDTFACDLLAKGVPLHDVSKLLGHSSVVTTERHYSRWIKGRQDRLTDLVTATWKNKELHF